MKNLIIAVLVIAFGTGVYLFMKNTDADTDVADEAALGMLENQEQVEETPEPAETGPQPIGKSVEGRDIIAHRFVATATSSASSTASAGETKDLLFVGGIHGGYGWNTALVAYELIDHLTENPEVIPQGVTVTVIPTLNPDGLYAIAKTEERFTKAQMPTDVEETVPGRFNANDVDLNRNFDCDWAAEAEWQGKDVSGGSAAFSEPESKAMREYIENETPDAVVVWYSSAGGVFASNCHDGVLKETTAMTKVYAKASGYRAFENFDFYEVTGDMVNWLARSGVPAISVLLSNHTDTEWSKNEKGIEALLAHFGEADPETDD